MFTVSSGTDIKTIRPGDSHFRINNGLMIAERAGFEISAACPYNHLQILQTCIDRGWIKPVAYATAEEYMIMQLSK